MPANIALVLDSSNSTASTNRTVQEAARRLVRKLRAGDLAQIVDFDSRFTVLQPFTDDSTKLEAAIGKLAVGGSSSLFNAVYIMLRDFRTAPAKRRHLMIVISDGEDTSSMLSLEEVLGRLRHSSATIYMIRVPSTDPRARRDNTMVMQMLAKESGGQALTAYSERDLDKIVDAISGDLANQYSLEFTPGQTASNRALHRLVVRVSRANATVRARLSYDASPSR